MPKNHLLFSVQVEQFYPCQNILPALQCTGAIVFSSLQTIFSCHFLVSCSEGASIFCFHSLHISEMGPSHGILQFIKRNYRGPNRVSMEDVKAQSFNFLPKTGSHHTTDALVHCCEESMSCFPTILATSFVHIRVYDTKSQCRPCQ